MPRKRKAQRIIYGKTMANPAGRRDADLAFHKCCQELRVRLRRKSLSVLIAAQ